MKIDDNFLQIISHDETLNKTQFELLGLSLHVDGWQDIVLAKDIDQEIANLLILLKGKLALKGQEVIVKNYQSMQIVLVNLYHNQFQ